MKSGVYFGETLTAQRDNTVDSAVDITYADNTTESSVKIANDLPRVSINRFKAIIAPLNGSPVLITAPDTDFATGSPRVRVTRFL
jgi:capsular polysaccharide biosynthesis protein